MPNYDARYSDIQRVDLVSGTGLIGTMNTVAIGGGSTVSVVNSAGWIVGLGVGTGLVGTMNTLAIGAGSLVSVVNTGGQVGLYSGTGLIGTMNTLAIGGGDTVSVVNSNNWAVFLNAGSMLVGTMNTLAIGGGDTVSVVNSAGWAVSVINTAGITLGAASAVVGSIRTLQYAPESTQLVAGAAMVGSMRTLQYAPESTQLVAGVAYVGTMAITGTTYTLLLPSSAGINAGLAVIGSVRTLQYAPESTQLVAGVAAIGTASVILMNTANWYVNVVNTAGITLGAASVVAGSIRTLQYAPESTQLVAGVALAGSMRTLQYAPESTQLVAGVAAIGTASVILMNTANWYVNVVNTANWVVNQANTGGQIGLYSGTGLIGTMNTLAIGGGDNVSIVNSANWSVYTLYKKDTTQFTSTSVNIASAGDNIAVAQNNDSGLKIYRVMLVMSSANTLVFADGTAGSATAFTGSMALAQNAGIVLDMSGDPWFTTSPSKGFVINLKNASNVAGKIDWSL